MKWVICGQRGHALWPLWSSPYSSIMGDFQPVCISYCFALIGSSHGLWYFSTRYGKNPIFHHSTIPLFQLWAKRTKFIVQCAIRQFFHVSTPSLSLAKYSGFAILLFSILRFWFFTLAPAIALPYCTYAIVLIARWRLKSTYDLRFRRRLFR